MTLFTTLILIISGSYFLVILFYFLGLKKLNVGNNKKHFSISIIVPARNEEKNISKCLNSLLNQDYPKDLYKIHVIDDHSTDKTVEIVKSFEKKYPKTIQLHSPKQTQETVIKAYKKFAIQYGIEHSEDELIFTIDADCWAQPTWFSSMVKYFENDVGMISGYILLQTQKNDSIFYKLQALEFLGLITATAGSLGMGFPVTSNGGNLAYRRSVFEEVDGFKGIDQLPSGDDDFLMHKINRNSNWKIRFAFEKSSVNYTNPEPTFKQFLNQRTRWSSKSTHYADKKVTLILSLVYFFYLYLLLGMVYSIFINFTILPFLLFSGKCLVEFIVVQKGCRVVGKTRLLKYFPLAQIFQIFYILIVGFRGIFGKYDWKGRQTQNYLGLNNNSTKNK